jgi:monoamine oxidase
MIIPHSLLTISQKRRGRRDEPFCDTGDVADTHVDVVVIGAGAAGLMALRDLDRAGISVLGLEARDRIGGRAFTLHDPMCPVPIELGAEFVHGLPSEVVEEAKSSRLAIYDVTRQMVHVDIANGKLEGDDDLSEEVDALFDEMVKFSERGGIDLSFSEWLNSTSYSDEVKKRATSFVEGFNAAHKERIGIKSLALDMCASEEIEADRNHRIVSGYDSLMQSIVDGIQQADIKLRLNQVVEQVTWTPGEAAVHVRSRMTGDLEVVHCRRVVITVPLGVLQAKPDGRGAIRFDPEPTAILQAASKLCFGQVVRVMLRFREAFWEKLPQLSDASFLFSQVPPFPTWWTTAPLRTSMITGWSAGPNAEDLLERSEFEIREAALASLSRITLGSAPRMEMLLEEMYLHKWNDDPFARGAYSYVPAGAMADRDRLAEPVAETLYFAGEATENTGHGGTVNGAMATGKRAALQVLKSLSKSA